uniref:Uncharacterized protein n=1 Tax=Myoviridae sp. cteBs22 TaxID=2826675 RepID=A0A8S5R147_9CAUD|nr:MAG TPA: hypothetical protein [Myoviridae sp. cteBs22]
MFKNFHPFFHTRNFPLQFRDRRIIPGSLYFVKQHLETKQ